ncbi:hypothetical protein ACFE04_017338 [Oxalis oulophora]
MSLITKRTPQFPGSIYIQSPTSADDVTTSLPPLQTLIRRSTSEEGFDEEMIMRALEIRRRVTAEIFKEEMRRKGKFGITYSTNVVEHLPDFIDFVMIKAAALKQLPEFERQSFNVRARAVIEDSTVVKFIRWLKHNRLSYPKIAKLICMSKGNLESIRPIAEWLKTIHVRSEFLGVVLLKSGETILERSREELDEIVDYLESNGVRREWMGYVMRRCPQLLSYNIDELKSRVEFYVGMGINKNDFGTMVYSYSRALGYYTLDEMNEKVNYLKEFGLNHEEVGRLLAFKPQLMGCSIEERWKPLVKFLYYLGVTRDGMRRMLTIKPMVFCVDMEDTIMPKVRFFQDIGIRDDAIGNMLVRFPPLLTYSLHKKIRRVVVFLMTQGGVRESDIGKIIALAPELLGCNVAHKLEVNVKFFLSLNIRPRQLGEMIADFPTLLRYNIDILRPKYKYLRRTMVRPLTDVIEYPRFFSYSLEDRIVPRHKIMVENRVNFKLRYMLGCSDEEFRRKVKDKVEKRKQFESGNRCQQLTDSDIEDGSLEEENVGDHEPDHSGIMDQEFSDYDDLEEDEFDFSGT